MSFFGLPMPGSNVSLKDQLRTVNKLRNAVQNGRLEKRAELSTELNTLAEAYIDQLQFNEALASLKEAIELVEILQEEGQVQPRLELCAAISMTMATLRLHITDETTDQVDRNAFSYLFDRCFEGVLDQITDEPYFFWGREICEQVQNFYEHTQAGNPAISRLNKAIQYMESRFNKKSDLYADWDNLMNPYRLRGSYKFDLGDYDGAIADLKRYEELADIANQKLNNVKKSKKSEMIDGKIVLRVNADDMLNFVGVMSFRNHWYHALHMLAHIYALKAEKDLALHYYDKALLATTSSPKPSVEEFDVYSAKADIPFRKANIYYQFHEPEKALELQTEAIRAIETLLETDEEETIQDLESLYNDYCFALSKTLQDLDRVDEALEWHQNRKQRFEQMKREAAKRFEEKKDDPLQAKDYTGVSTYDLLSEMDMSQIRPCTPQDFAQGRSGFSDSPIQSTKKKSKVEPEKKEPGEYSERDILIHIGQKHNDAMGDVQTANLEMARGRFRTALSYLLKARLILDFRGMASAFPEMDKNRFMVFFLIGTVYSELGEYDKSIAWMKRTIEEGQSLVEKGELEYRSHVCAAQAALARAYSMADQMEQAVEFYETSFEARKALIDEQMEGLSESAIARLYKSDNQRIMRIAEEVDKQMTCSTGLIYLLLYLNRLEEANEQIDEHLQYATLFAQLLQGSSQAAMHGLETQTKKLIVLRLLQQNEEADHFQERMYEFILKTGAEVEFKQEDLRKLCIQQLGVIAFSFGDNLELKEDYADALELLQEGETEKALEAIKEIRAKIDSNPWFGPDKAPIVGELKQVCLDLMDGTLEKITANPSAAAQELDDIESVAQPMSALHQYIAGCLKYTNRVDENDTEDYSIYERDLSQHDTTLEMMLTLTDELRGSNVSEAYIKSAIAKAKNMQFGSAVTPVKKSGLQVGRNELCPCGSGKKYKKCCMKK